MKWINLVVLNFLYLSVSCSSQHKLTNSAPFTVGEAICEIYPPENEEGTSGFVLEIPVVIELNSEVTFKQIYFRGHSLVPELTEFEGKKFIFCEHKGRIRKAKPDIIMHADPKKEVGNQPPKLHIRDNQNYEFNIEKNEAVIHYSWVTKNSKESKLEYFKISGIKEKFSEEDE